MHAAQYQLLLHRRRRRWWRRRRRGRRRWWWRWRLNDRIAIVMARDSAYYSADSCAGNRTRGDSRIEGTVAFCGLADTEASASANQRARGGAVNGAPTQLALLRASAQKQRQAGHRWQQKRRYTRSIVHVPSHRRSMPLLSGVRASKHLRSTNGVTLVQGCAGTINRGLIECDVNAGWISIRRSGSALPIARGNGRRAAR